MFQNANVKGKSAKCISLIFCIAISMTALLSCEKDEKTPDRKTISQEDSTVAEKDSETTLSREDISDDLPDISFEGAAFTIMYPNWSTYQHYLVAEGQTGEVMNDAIYKREITVEERFDVQIEWVKIEDQGLSNLKTSVQADSHEYDLAFTHYSNSLDSFAADSYVVDWNIIPNINFEKPWWNKDSNETLSINGKIFFTVSDIMLLDPNATFFNKDMVKNYGLEDPYQIVRDGKWTYDKLYELGTKVAQDLNGDGKWTDQDQYGLVTQLA